MSWRASAHVKELRVCPNGEPLTPYEKLVALVLADSHQDKTHAYTFPAARTIADDAGVSLRHCVRLLDSLEVKGVIHRLRPDRQGRGQLTFYSFPALDELHVESAKKRVTPRHPSVNQRVTEGCQKDDNGRTAISEEQEHERKNIKPPDPLARKGGMRRDREAIQRAVESVMSACSFTSTRLAASLARVVAMEADKGEPHATTALRMAAAWKRQGEMGHLLRVKYGPRNFFETVWHDENLWHWDRNALEATKMH